MTGNILYANAYDDYCAGYQQNVDNIYLGYAVGYQLLVASGQEHKTTLFRCPSDKQYWESLNDNFNGLPATSYIWGRADWQWNGSGMSQTPTVTKVSRVREPSKYYLIADRGAEKTDIGEAVSALAHNLAYNISFLDGHATGCRFLAGVYWKDRNY